MTIVTLGEDVGSPKGTRRDTGSPMKKIASHSIRDLRQQILIYKNSRNFRFCRMSSCKYRSIEMLKVSSLSKLERGSIEMLQVSL